MPHRGLALGIITAGFMLSYFYQETEPVLSMMLLGGTFMMIATLIACYLLGGLHHHELQSV